jgi:dethiobiotin synthetase
VEIHSRAEELVLVTGTDTGVGKTVVTAAIAAAAGAAGRSVAVVKPAQTGTAGGEPTDVAEVVRLAAPDRAVTLAEYPEPLAPLIAARLAGSEPLRLPDVVPLVRDLAATYDLVLVEGAGGLLVPLGEVDGHGWTLLDLADAAGGAQAVVVTRAGLGTLNHTALTLAALARDDVPATVVVGAWPEHPELVHRSNLAELRRGLHHLCGGEIRGELVGVVPDGAGRMAPAEFRRAAATWLAS